MTLRLSIAMATYNGAKYLHQQLESLANQTVKPFELVVCDDGSSDETVKVLKNYDLPFPVRVYENEQRLNFTGNFLKAASLCSGDVIAFCDQDDIWDPRKVEICLAEFEKNGSDLVVHSGRIIDENGKLTQYKWPDIANKGNLLFGPTFEDAHGFAMVVRSSLISELMTYWSWSEYLDCAARFVGMPNIIGHSRFINAWSYKRKKGSLVDRELVLWRRHGANTSAFFADSLIRGDASLFGRLKRSISMAKKFVSILVSSDKIKTEYLRWAEFHKAEADFVHAYHARFGYNKLPGLRLYEDSFLQRYKRFSTLANASNTKLFVILLTERLGAFGR